MISLETCSRWFKGRTSRAGFHHRSTRITLLHAVKLSPGRHVKIGKYTGRSHLPVLPALKEINMTRVLLLDLIFARAASRSFVTMEPSSAAVSELYIRHFTSQLTANIFDSLFAQKGFDKIKHFRELREDDSLLFTAGTFVDLR
jgi:hypothetical protein